MILSALARRLEEHCSLLERFVVFVAWRDLRFARGRFVLIGAVVALITLLVGFLAGLTGGLAAQNVSAVLALPGERLVLQQTEDGAAEFSTSTITAETVAEWEAAAGVEAVLPVGILQARAETTSSTGVALFGLPDAASDAQGFAGNQLLGLAPAADGEIGLSAGAAQELDAAVGDTVTIANTDYTVTQLGDDAWYSHTPVITMTPHDWATIDTLQGGSGDATVLAVSGTPDWNALESRTDTVSQSPLLSLSGLETFKSEIGSLGLMIAMLFGISALVVGAFFTVWTMQRSGDIAVLKALGATNGSLLRDALGQALVVLGVGIGIGIAAVALLGSLAGTALPFLLSPWTTLAPAVVMALLGLAGGAFALRSVTRADPLTALGSHR